METYEEAITDRLTLPKVAVLAEPSVLRPASLTAGMGASDGAAYLRRSLALAESSMTLSHALAALGYYRPTIAELIGLFEDAKAGEPVTATDTVGVASAVSAAQAKAIIEALGLNDTLLANAITSLTVSEALRLLDSLYRFFSGDISETIALDPTVLPTKLAIASAAAGVGVNAAVNRTLVLRVTAPDGVEFEDSEVLKLFFRPTLQDYVEIAAAYISPDDVFTVWNVNASNGAVSQYDNYTFNSFARFGQMYLGADSEGLYELNGCNDEGSAIIARIKSGLAQLTESRFTMIRDAYLGMRGDGTFVLRIATGEGDVYDYAFDTENMKTVRVPLGKGMRTRYVSFELISTGSDFDLESVEFIPLMSNRRV